MKLSKDVIDALRELINIGVGRSAAVLSEMLERPIKLKVPEISIIDKDSINDNLFSNYPEKLSSVLLDYSGNFEGRAIILFPTQSAINLVSVLTGEDPGTPDLDSIRAGTLNEVGNIVLNGIMGTIANILKEKFSYNIPIYAEEKIDELIQLNREIDGKMLIIGTTSLIVEELEIAGDILLVMGFEAFEQLENLISQIGD